MSRVDRIDGTVFVTLNNAETEALVRLLHVTVGTGQAVLANYMLNAEIKRLEPLNSQLARI